MKLFPYKWVRISAFTWVRVSNAPYQNSFEVESRYDRQWNILGFLPVRYPGCGIFIHASASHTYQRREQALRDAFAPTYWNVLKPQQPSYASLTGRVEHALALNQDSFASAILEFYRNKLLLAREIDHWGRYQQALRRAMRRSNDQHRYSAAMKNCRRILETAEKKSLALSFPFDSFYSEEQMQAFATFVKAFHDVCNVHHIWDTSYHDNCGDHDRVFFDLGSFCYIASPVPLPRMCDSHGGVYYIFPDRVLCVRTPYDFDTVMLRDMDIRCGAFADGRQSELMLPPTRLFFRFSSVKRVETMAQAWNELKQLV